MRPMGRLLVLLTTLLVLVMPVTEHLCNWDHFLRGGQDVEFNLLAVLLFAAMVVLSMSGTTMQPPMMQPLRMQAAYGGRNGSCGGVTPRVRAWRGFSRKAASNPPHSPDLDDPASVSGSRPLTKLRI